MEMRNRNYRASYLRLCLGLVLASVVGDELRAEVVTVARVSSGELRSTDTGDKKRIFDLLSQSPCTPFLKRVGALSVNSPDRKVLTTALHLHTLKNPSEKELNHFDLLPIVRASDASGKQPCAVFVLGDASFIPKECDDGSPGGLCVRSLPNGGLIKRSILNGMMVDLEFPFKRGSAQLLVFVPGRESAWHIVTLKMVPSVQDISMALAPYLSEGAAMDYINPFCSALLCNENNHLAPTDVRALFEAYALLSSNYGCSPVWVHRVLNLFLLMNPHEASDFVQKIKNAERGRKAFVMRFFHFFSLGKILEQHPKEEIDADLVKELLAKTASL
jgi:hypothetical protein